MSRPYCRRCETQVILEQDGSSCSNCGETLIAAPPPTAPQPDRDTANATARSHLRRRTQDVKDADATRQARSEAIEKATNRLPEPEPTPEKQEVTA